MPYSFSTEGGGNRSAIGGPGKEECDNPSFVGGIECIHLLLIDVIKLPGPPCCIIVEAMDKEDHVAIRVELRPQRFEHFCRAQLGAALPIGVEVFAIKRCVCDLPSRVFLGLLGLLGLWGKRSQTFFQFDIHRANAKHLRPISVEAGPKGAPPCLFDIAVGRKIESGHFRSPCVLSPSCGVSRSTEGRMIPDSPSLCALWVKISLARTDSGHFITKAAIFLVLLAALPLDFGAQQRMMLCKRGK